MHLTITATYSRTSLNLTRKYLKWQHNAVLVAMVALSSWLRRALFQQAIIVSSTLGYAQFGTTKNFVYLFHRSFTMFSLIFHIYDGARYYSGRKTGWFRGNQDHLQVAARASRETVRSDRLSRGSPCLRRLERSCSSMDQESLTNTFAVGSSPAPVRSLPGGKWKSLPETC